MTNIAVFASGTGSNFLAILDAIENKELDLHCALLVSDKPQSLVVERAKQRGVKTLAITPKSFPSKTAYEATILEHLKKHHVSFLALAGYMRLIGPTLLQAYPRRIVNIHPSLLPSFKGLDAVGQAMSAGVKVTGVTIHYVDEGMDTGEIIAQESLDISNLTTREHIETAIHTIEHQLYPKTLASILKEDL